MSDAVIKVQRYLAEIPELAAEAEHYRTPGAAPLDPMFKPQGKGSVYKIPIVPEIYDLLSDNDKAMDDVMLNRSGGERRLGVLPTLGLWVSLAYAELDDLGREPRDCCPARQHTVVGEAGWLAEYAHDIIELHSDFPRDIELLWQELRKACRIRREYVPKCNKCRNVIEAIEDGKGPAWWRCTGCPETWVHDAEVQRLALTRPPMTLIQMAAFLALPVRDLYRLRDEIRFMPVGRSKRGGMLYELEQVRRAVENFGKMPLSA